MDNVTLSIDVMSGDHGIDVTVPAALEALKKNADLNIILVGREGEIQQFLNKQKNTFSEDRLKLFHADQVVDMDELASHALKKKKNSSLRQSINLVKEGQADACVSAGNTGALMATARYVLKTLPGIDRPALITMLPSNRGHVHVLDLGSNIDSSAQTLVQFAVMGSVLVSTVERKSNPSVGLLNVGVEEIKGNEVIKKAAEILKQTQLNYVGFVEGDDIYTGNVDVIVCDGFVGNVALKTSEGLAQMLRTVLREEFDRNIIRKLCLFFSWPALLAIKKRIDHRRYNGATLVGLNSTVIKSHGGADSVAFEAAINEAYKEAKRKVPEKISYQIKHILGDQ